MDLILATADGREEEIVEYDLDMEVGEENNFEIGIPKAGWREKWKTGKLLYIPGTEYGGIIGEIESQTYPEDVYIRGMTWRGRLKKKIISPRSGQDYYTISGEANACITTILTEFYADDLIRGSSEASGLTINFQFARYVNLMDGITAMLSAYGYRPEIRYIQDGTGGYAELAAVPVINYGATVELTEDDELRITADTKEDGVNHLICLGQGELAERTVVHIYADASGTIRTSQVLFGRDEIAEVFEDTGAETEADLRAAGLVRMREIVGGKTFSATVGEIEAVLQIGDIISGRDYTTGIHVEKPIASKILKITGGVPTVEYGLEGE